MGFKWPAIFQPLKRLGTRATRWIGKDIRKCNRRLHVQIITPILFLFLLYLDPRHLQDISPRRYLKRTDLKWQSDPSLECNVTSIPIPKPYLAGMHFQMTFILLLTTAVSWSGLLWILSQTLRQESTLNGTPVHCSTSCTHSFTPRAVWHS